MSSTVSVEQITKDIAALNLKIERCNKSKQDYLSHIEKEKESITELNFYLREDSRLPTGAKKRYDADSLVQEINAHYQHINLFGEMILKEDRTISQIKGMIDVLTEDIKRPKEIIFDAKTGQIISQSN